MFYFTKTKLLFLLVSIALLSPAMSFGDTVPPATPATTNTASQAPTVGNYTPLAPISLGNTGDSSANKPVCSTNVANYIIDMYKFAIGIATVLAILMIVIGGVQYMSTDAISGKSEGRERIQQALWGLLLIMTSYIILYTINPNLISLNIISTTQTGASCGGQTTPAPATK